MNGNKPAVGEHLSDGNTQRISRRAVIALPLMLAHQGCASKPTAPAVDTPETSVESGNVNVYLDATMSMQGFVRGQEPRYYSLLIEDLQGSAFWFKEANVDFHRFGGDVGDLSPGQQIQARRPEFYTELETRIDNVVEKADPSSLSVIVTDLFQEDNDLHRLAQGIRDKYLKAGLAVGVFGVRSSFSGEIFDIGVSRSHVTHTRKRPFYLVCLGRQSQIETLFVRLPERLGRFQDPNAPQEWNSVIFGQSLAERTPQEASVDLPRAAGITKVESLVIPQRRDARLVQLIVRDVGRMPRGNVEKGEKSNYGELRSDLFTVRQPCRARPFTVPYEPNGLVGIVSVDKYVRGGRVAGTDLESQFREAPEALGRMAITNIEVKAGNVIFKAELERGPLEKQQIYRFRILIAPAREAYKMPGWIDEWSVDNILSRFDGTKTLNLGSFIADLWDASQQYRARVTEYCCYLKRI